MYALKTFDCLGIPCELYLATNKNDLYPYIESIFEEYKGTTGGYTLLLVECKGDILVDYRRPWNSKNLRNTIVLESYYKDEKQGKYVKRDESNT